MTIARHLVVVINLMTQSNVYFAVIMYNINLHTNVYQS